jgi:hypothetical protein
VFFVLARIYGFSKVSPVYYLITLYTSNDPIYQRTTGRNIDPAVAKALLPGLLIGYVLPTSLGSSAFTGQSEWHYGLGLFAHLAPLLSSPLTTFIASLIRGVSPRAEPDAFELRELDNDDVSTLRSTYSIVFWATTAVHVSTMFHIFTSPWTSFQRVFLDLQNPFKRPSCACVDEQLFYARRCDVVLHSAVLLIWCLYTAFEMRRLGYVRTLEAVLVGVLVLLGVVAVGPGAVYIGMWHWREKVISGLSQG